MFNYGLIIGKFWPPHIGHQGLWEKAAEKSKNLLILVEEQRKERVDVDQRVAWAKQTMGGHPHVQVRALYGSHPQTPDEHPKFWLYWHNILAKQLSGPIDALFANESYGKTLAQGFGAQWVHFDMNREEMPTSGTILRKKPWENWFMLQKSVRQDMVRRVILLGAESTGKSRLAQKLARSFKTQHVPEWAEEYIKSGADPTDTDFYKIIIKNQKALSEKTSQISGPVMIEDSNAITTLVYQKLYTGQIDPDVLKSAIAEKRKMDAVILMSPEGCPYVHDVHRDKNIDRNKAHEMIKKFLDDQDIPYCEIDGGFSQREERAFFYTKGLIDSWKKMNFEDWWADKNHSA